MKRPAGSTMIELLVAMSMFLVLSALIFSFFRYGTRAFQEANARQGLQMEALRVAESLQKELKRTNGASVKWETSSVRTMTVVEDEESVQVHRDAVSFLGLREWADLTNANNFEQNTMAPLWNRYWVFYATKEPIGRLVRLSLRPDPPPHAPRPMLDEFFLPLLSDDPGSNVYAGVKAPYVVLSKSVHEFKRVVTGLEKGEYNISLKLKEKHQPQANESGARREFDHYEIKMTIRPENSFPNEG